MTIKDKSRFFLPFIVLVFVASLVVFVYSLVFSNPTALGPGGVTFWFIDTLVMTVLFFTLVFYKFQLKRPKYIDKKSRCLSDSFRSGMILGISATVLLALSSLRSLSWRDFILFIILILVVELYFRTRRAAR